MMEHIETIELGSSQASITFSSIPQDYDDLVVTFSARTDNNNSIDTFSVSMNAVGSTGVRLRGTGSVVATEADHEALITGATATSNTFSNSTIYISNYTIAQAHSFSIDSVGENNATDAPQSISAGLSTSTAAVTSVKFDPVIGTNFVSGSTASLYGVTAGGDGTVTTA